MIKCIMEDFFIGAKRIIAYILCLKCKIDETKIVVDNFLGMGFANNPRYIIEQLHNRNPNYKIVWVCKGKNEFTIPYVQIVKYGSIRALCEYQTAKIWIDNVRNSIHPIIKRKDQIYLQTWHGAFPFKYVEGQAKDLNKRYIKKAKRDATICSGILSPNRLFTEIMRSYFWIKDPSKVLELGFPETDIFFDLGKANEIREQLRKHYSINSDDIVVLYMPTFRDDTTTEVFNLNFNEIKRVVETRTKRNCKILIRMHPNIKNVDFIEFSDCIISASDYPDGNELMFASDWIISDYSSVIYIAIMLDKPTFLYVPDLDEYIKKRGLNDCYYLLPCERSRTVKDLERTISLYNSIDYKEKYEEFKTLVDAYNLGKSSLEVAKWIEKSINN